jgi:hypothetical protein
MNSLQACAQLTDAQVTDLARSLMPLLPIVAAVMERRKAAQRQEKADGNDTAVAAGRGVPDHGREAAAVVDVR